MWLLIPLYCLHHIFLIFKKTCIGAAIAGVYRSHGSEMGKLIAVAWGVGQTVMLIIISFTRILATL